MRALCEGNLNGGNRYTFPLLENYISDTCFDKMVLERKPWNGGRIGVVGAGPAGITIAILMACRGYKVTIFEVREKIGGILRYGIPEFRLPKSILDRYYKKMRELGILFRPNFALGGSTAVHDLLADGYDAVFIGTGTWRPYKLNNTGRNIWKCALRNQLSEQSGCFLNWETMLSLSVREMQLWMWQGLQSEKDLIM
mgnify:CR=1 FL=1